MVEDPKPEFAQPAADELVALDRAHSLFRASNDVDFYFNAVGASEKWLRGRTNTFGNEWYFILDAGTLHEWDGSRAAAGNQLATDLPESVYDDPLLLADAFADGSVLNNPLTTEI